MTKGKKTDNETIYKVMVSMFRTNNFSQTARDLLLPITTVEKIYKDNKDKPDFVNLCNKTNEEFVVTATRIIEKATKRLEKTIDSEEEYIPINHLTTAIGTLYDKRALATGNSTVNANVSIESFLSKVTDESEY